MGLNTMVLLLAIFVNIISSGYGTSIVFNQNPTFLNFDASITVTSPPNPLCEDKYSTELCKNFALYNVCTTDGNNMAFYCERTCGFCHDKCVNEDPACTAAEDQCRPEITKIPLSSCKALCGGCEIPTLRQTIQLEQVFNPAIPKQSNWPTNPPTSVPPPVAQMPAEPFISNQQNIPTFNSQQLAGAPLPTDPNHIDNEADFLAPPDFLEAEEREKENSSSAASDSASFEDLDELLNKF